MTNRLCRLPEHDLILHVVTGTHTGAEAIEFFRGLDATCAMRWLSYFDPTAELSQLDVASLPVLKQVIAEKRTELFGDKPKAHLIVAASEATARQFRFWRQYFGHGDENAVRIFRSLDEAYDWLGLPKEGRAAVTRAVERP